MLTFDDPDVRLRARYLCSGALSRSGVARFNDGEFVLSYYCRPYFIDRVSSSFDSSIKFHKRAIEYAPREKIVGLLLNMAIVEVCPF